MPLDSYVTLGRSGLRVSPFTLGTMTFGEDWGWGWRVAESEAMLDDYLERGGNLIDTANGHAETAGRKAIVRQLEQSLRRLRTDYVAGKIR